MIRSLALLLSSLAAGALPLGREDWGAAMRAEVEQIEGDAPALAFSASCICAALKERAMHIPDLALAGLWSVALFTAGLAVFQIACGTRGAAILLGSPDPYLEMLLNGTPEQRSLARLYSRATPAAVACLLLLGVAQALAALFLVMRKRRLFVLASWAALASCTVLGGVIASVGLGTAAIPVQSAALVLQALALPVLWPLLTPVPAAKPRQGVNKRC